MKVSELKISPAKPQQTIESHGTLQGARGGNTNGKDEVQRSEQGTAPAMIAHQVVKRKAAKLTASIGDKGTKVKCEFFGKRAEKQRRINQTNASAGNGSVGNCSAGKSSDEYGTAPRRLEARGKGQEHAHTPIW